jgi:integrase
MASVVERSTAPKPGSKKGERRLYVKFSAHDRLLGRQRVIWELQPPGTGKKDADRRKAKIEELLHANAGKWPPPGEARPTGTVTEYAKEWLESYAKANVKPRVYVNYETSVRLHIKPVLGNLLLGDIGPADAKRLVAAMRERGLADATIRNAIVPLREMLGHAAEDRLIPVNPLSDVRLFGNRKRTARKVVPPTRAEVDKILAKMSSDEAREAVRVAAALGLRRGEMFALRWADIDHKTNTVKVHASNFGGKVVETVKTEAGERTLPLFPSVRKLLLERKAREQFSAPHNFVFGTSLGTPVDPGNFVKREFKPACAAAGVNFRWHDLRHFAVSELIKQRADILLLAKIAGHSKPSVTLDVYGHLMDEAISEAADKFDPLKEASSA